MIGEFVPYLRSRLEEARGRAAVAALARDDVRTKVAVGVADCVQDILNQAEALAREQDKTAGGLG